MTAKSDDIIQTIARRDAPALDGSTVFRVGKFRCTMTLANGQMTTEWSPGLPTPKQMNKAMWREYRAGRNTFLAEVSRQIGGAIAVIET
jgi:hypothetical protein